MERCGIAKCRRLDVTSLAEVRSCIARTQRTWPSCGLKPARYVQKFQGYEDEQFVIFFRLICPVHDDLTDTMEKI